MLARVGVAAAGPGIDKTRGRGKDRLRAWTRGAGRTGRSIASVGSRSASRAGRSGCASWAGRKRSCAELAVSVDENRITAALIDSVYSSDEGCYLRAGLPDADRIFLARNVGRIPSGWIPVSDVDIVIAGVEVVARARTNSDVESAGGVVIERINSGNNN